MVKIGRNDPCPCGSQKKFKKCHGSPITQPESSASKLPLFTPSDLPRHSPEGLIYKFYCLAFLDILGQRRKLRQLSRHLKKDDETKRLLQETVGHVLQLRNRLKTIFEKLGEPTGFSTSVPAALIERLQAAKQAVHYRGFSDSLIMSIPLGGDIDQCVPVVGTYCCMGACCLLHLSSLAEKHPIRGGIDVGPGMDLSAFQNLNQKEQEVYGPCLESAHYLESRVADYPRIVIGDTLWKYLQEVASHTPTSVAGKIAKHYANECQKLVIITPDGPMLDFLGEKMAKLSSADERREMFSLANNYVGEQLDWAQSENDQERLGRYVKLRAYFESRKELWT